MKNNNIEKSTPKTAEMKNNAVESKQSNSFVNGLKKAGKSLWTYIKQLGYDIKRSVSENPNTIFGILLMIPAILIGFMLSTHISASQNLPVEAKFNGLYMFILEMAGCLNVVWGFAIMKKRNLKSSIYATVTTLIITVCGILWISDFLKYSINGEAVINASSTCLQSVICVAISLVCAIAGTIASFFFINKNYKKDTL